LRAFSAWHAAKRWNEKRARINVIIFAIIGTAGFGADRF